MGSFFECGFLVEVKVDLFWVRVFDCQMGLRSFIFVVAIARRRVTSSSSDPSPRISLPSILAVIVDVIVVSSILGPFLLARSAFAYASAKAACIDPLGSMCGGEYRHA